MDSYAICLSCIVLYLIILLLILCIMSICNIVWNKPVLLIFTEAWQLTLAIDYDYEVQVIAVYSCAQHCNKLRTNWYSTWSTVSCVCLRLLWTFTHPSFSESASVVHYPVNKVFSGRSYGRRDSCKTPPARHSGGGIEIQQQRRQMESPHYFMHFENFDFIGAVVISELKWTYCNAAQW